jgi:hypothetical protein
VTPLYKIVLILIESKSLFKFFLKNPLKTKEVSKMTKGMTARISAKLNKIFKLKQEVKYLETELKPLVEEVKEIATSCPKNEKGLWVLENGIVRASVTSIIKVQNEATDYLQDIGRNDLISMRPFTTKDDLSKIMGIEEMLDKNLISYIYTLKVNQKD